MSANIVHVSNGGMALSARPKAKYIPQLRGRFDLIVTALMESEGGRDVRQSVSKSGMDSMWIPFTVRKFPADASPFQRAIRAIADRVRAGDNVLIHCSAGMHRTGTLAYATLRTLGYEHDATMALITEMRPVTAKEVQRFLHVAKRMIPEQEAVCS